MDSILRQDCARAATVLACCALAALGLASQPALAQLTAGGNGNASGTQSIAISPNTGGAAKATASESIAVGTNAEASDVGAVAIGSNNVAGNRAQATAGDAIAIGANARANGIGSVSLGGSTQAGGQNSVAAGFGASASANTAVAIGNGAQASAVGAVAIGQGSVANQANTVSVGSAGNERRVTNVAAGVAGTDAVNVNQLNAYALGAAAPAVDALNSRVGTLENRLDDVTRSSYRGIAGVAAMAIAVPSAPGRTAVNIGVGSYQGYNAMGVSVAHLASGGRLNFSGGMSFAAGKPVTRIGVGFSF